MEDMGGTVKMFIDFGNKTRNVILIFLSSLVS